MTLLAPGFLYGSIAIAAGIVALHFLVMRQPRSRFLPTARFVPDARTTIISPARRPTDLALLLLRVLTVLLVGAALARPLFQPSRRAAGRVILVDASRSSLDSVSLRDSARAAYRDGDAVVVFDSSARLLNGRVDDSLRTLRSSGHRGNLSAALIAALRAGSSMRNRFDSLELVVVSPLAKEEFDAATDSIRALWPGGARLVRLAEPSQDSLQARGRLQLIGDANDPLAITLGLHARSTSDAIVDRSPGGSPVADSVVRILWPSASRPPRAATRATPDTVGGVIAGEAVVVAPLERRWTFPTDSLRGAEVVARWMDGEPAAIELPNATSCKRSVAIPITPVGDLVIRKDFVALVAELARPCSAQTALVPADPSVIARLAGKGSAVSRENFQPVTDTRSPLAPWLLGLALIAAIGELVVRRRVAGAQLPGVRDNAAQEARAA